MEDNPKTRFDLYALPLTGGKQPVVVANTDGDENQAQISPDGRWIAYLTTESGRSEVVVQAFPEPTRKFPISTSGGVQPRWRADGKALYFVALDGTLMEASLSISATKVQSIEPAPLFRTRIVGTTAAVRPQYDVTPDTQFLINETVEGLDIPPINILFNWKPRPED
jgi:hypothetical protein